MAEDSDRIVAIQPPDRASAKAGKSRQRSRLSNKPGIILGTDQRSAWVRRFRDVCHDLIGHCGGEADISEVQLSLARRAASLTVELEKLETVFATEGSSASALMRYGSLSNTLRRLLADLGIVAKHKEPEDLVAYRKRVYGR